MGKARSPTTNRSIPRKSVRSYRYVHKYLFWLPYGWRSPPQVCQQEGAGTSTGGVCAAPTSSTGHAQTSFPPPNHRENRTLPSRASTVIANPSRNANPNTMMGPLYRESVRLSTAVVRGFVAVRRTSPPSRVANATTTSPQSDFSRFRLARTLRSSYRSSDTDIPEHPESKMTYAGLDAVRGRGLPLTYTAAAFAA
mmetsp:Transcript_22984/g.55379  ORF Transcript_22984/g.55379 Transcript_22984/m.55379 type:complete len:196 (-) Transcript_22984:957-1544(-)